MLLEARTLAHAGAGSYGETRMFRERNVCPIPCCAVLPGKRIAFGGRKAQAGEQLRETHGLLFYGEGRDEEAIEGSIPGARRVMDDQGIPYASA